MNGQRILVIAIIVLIALFIGGMALGANGGIPALGTLDFEQLNNTFFGNNSLGLKDLTLSAQSAATCITAQEIVIGVGATCTFTIPASSSNSRRIILHFASTPGAQIVVNLDQNGKPEALPVTNVLQKATTPTPGRDPSVLKLSIFEKEAVLKLGCPASNAAACRATVGK